MGNGSEDIFSKNLEDNEHIKKLHVKISDLLYFELKPKLKSIFIIFGRLSIRRFTNRKSSHSSSFRLSPNQKFGFLSSIQAKITSSLRVITMKNYN